MALVERLPRLGITLVVIEHVMRFLVQLSTRIMILHHGERIYEGSARGMVRNQTVVDVYLGEGTSVRLGRLLSNEDAHVGPGARS
jgi:branched-chain amino acid transport system ATP-binding protein